MPENATLVKLVKVSKSFAATYQAPPVHVLRDINFEIGTGDSAAIIGPSGSGKSTLLNLIGTLDSPNSGEVHLDGQDLSTLNETELARIRNQKIGFIFQAHHLLPQCTVLENVLVPTLVDDRNSIASPAVARDRGCKLLERVGLGQRLHHRPGQLSGGEQQRVAVVRALINQPKLLLADEPTGALDRTTARELGQLLVELNREEQVTLIVVTHTLDLAHQMAKVFTLRDGELILDTARP
jgi:ABC-type lipoprotein export system ATPase subunit